MSIRRTLIALMLGLAMVSIPLRAATIEIVEGTGLDDTTEVDSLGDDNNPYTTLGEQRLYVFQTAANQWGQLLNSTITIRILANMGVLPCDTFSATLGSAGPTNAYANFPNAPYADTFYVTAQANALANDDLDNAGNDIQATFNARLDNGNNNCLFGTTWYYGTNPDYPIPNGTIPLLPVAFHEIGHGLGFLSLVDTDDGTFPSGIPDIWSYYQYDLQLGETWKDMSNAERLISQTNDPDLVWAGTETNRLSPVFLDSTAGTTQGCVQLYAPSSLEPGSSVSHFHSDASPDLLMEPSLNDSIFNLVDLTLPLFQDIGWSTNTEDLLFYDGMDPNPCGVVQP